MHWSKFLTLLSFYLVGLVGGIAMTKHPILTSIILGGVIGFIASVVADEMQWKRWE